MCYKIFNTSLFIEILNTFSNPLYKIFLVFLLIHYTNADSSLLDDSIINAHSNFQCV